MSTIQQIPRSAVRLGLAATRLPLTTAEVVLGKQGDDAWAPALVFEGVEAQVEQVLGALLRDEVLVDDGRLRSAKVERLRHAAEAEAEAARLRDDADETFAERRERIEAEKAEADRAESERKAQIARDEAEAKRKAEAEARKAEREAAATERKAKQAAQRKARRSKAEALGAEEQALAEEQAATARARDAMEADAKVKATKAARKMA
jgi:colicin import membrane protein